MIKNHGYTLEAIENMLPWERDIQVSLINHWIQKRNQEIERMRMKSGRR